MLEIDDKAPEFTLNDDTGSPVSLKDYLGKRVLLVFYPGDNTPVCTRQLCDYRDGIEAFADLGVEVVGISKDDAESHQKFKDKYKLPFTLLSDPDLEVADLYDCKGMLGMKRAVFLVDESGRLKYIHIEALALFRRQREELLEVIAGLN